VRHLLGSEKHIYTGVDCELREMPSSLKRGNEQVRRLITRYEEDTKSAMEKK